MVGRVIAHSVGPDRPASTVSAAVAAWRSIRAFEDRPVDEAEIRDIVRRAARAPSGSAPSAMIRSPRSTSIAAPPSRWTQIPNPRPESPHDLIDIDPMPARA
jgi:nitroreductase